MPRSNADQHTAQARIGIAIAVGLCLMLAAVLLVRPSMAMYLVHEMMNAL